MIVTTVAAHRERLKVSSTPTAVAVSTLGVCAPAVANRDEPLQLLSLRS